MNNKPRSAVLFDMDGTLIDSTYFHAVSWWQALRQHGHSVPTAALHRAVGMGGEELVHHFLGSGTAPEHVSALIEAHDAIFSTHWPALVPFSAAKELLEHCAGAGAAVILASSAQQTELDVLRAALDADSAITAATSSSDAQRGKPSPDILAAALSAADSDPAHACFVGDAVWDAKAAGALGLPMVGVCSGGTSEAELRAAGAMEVYRDVQELLDNIEGSVLGSLLHPGTEPPHQAANTDHNTTNHNSQETTMKNDNEVSGQENQAQATEDGSTEQRNKRKDAEGLPDGSGSTRKGSNEQGQEDGGKSFDAG